MTITQNYDDDPKETDPLKSKSSENGEKKKKVKKPKEKTVSYLQLFRYATILDKLYIAFGLFCSIVVGGTQPYLMIIFGDVTGVIVDYAKAYNAMNKSFTPEQKAYQQDLLFDGVKEFCIISCAIGTLSIITTYLSSVCLTYSALRQIFQYRKLFLENTLNQDISWFDTHKTGDFASTFTDNLSKIEDGIGEKIAIFLYFETIFVVGVIMAFIKGWQLTLICLISLPLSAAAMGGITWLSSKFSKQEMEAYSAAGSIAEEVLNSIRTVVAFEGQRKEYTRYEKHLIFAKKNNMKKAFFTALSNGLLWFFTYAAIALSFWYGVGLVIDESKLPEKERVYTAGNMVAVFFLTMIAGWNFGSGTPFMEVFGTAQGAAVKVFELLDSKPTINLHKTCGQKPTEINGAITFNSVYFNYPSRSDVKILRGFSIKVKSGDTVALVGSSGCGKSTVIQLIQRFYDAESGEISIDHYDIKDLNLTWLRNQIGMVGQEPALFAATIAENIRYGNLKATQQDIEEAAKKANAHKFIMQLPKGYETIIGEKGSQLSGGQKQRIAIARALVRKPKILLLDEATSALDTTSEREVQAAIDKACGECTTIIVAHRLSTIRNANRIVVVSEGQVVEEGSHEELMLAKGNYYNLVTSQGFDDLHDKGNKEDRGETFLRRMSSTESTTKDKAPLEDEESSDAQEEVNQGSIIPILKENKPEWFWVFLGCVASIVNGASLPIYAVIFGNLIGVLANTDHDEMRLESNLYSLFFLILGIVSGISSYVQVYAFSLTSEKLTMRIRGKMFWTMLNQEIGWFDRKENGVGALCAKLSGEAASVQGAGGVRIGAVLNCIATFIIANAISLYFQWKLTFVLLCFAPVILMSVFFEQKFTQADSKDNQKLLESSAKIAVEAIGSIRTVASLGCEKMFHDNYVDMLIPYQKNVKRKCHFRGFIVGIARSMMMFAYAAGIAYGAKLMVDEDVDYGIIFKVNEIVIAGSWSIGNAFTFSPNFQKGLQAASRIFILLNRVPEIRNAENPVVITNTKNVNYNNVYFSYPTRQTVSVLNGLDLSVNCGKSIALVGGSGCGKSTIIQLLERFYDPNVGDVLIDGRSSKIIDISSLRAQLSIVSQEPNLFDKTIAENIAYGDNSRTVDINEIEEAAKCANIHNFVTSLPLGYETNLGSKGAQLSGGQKQRIAIARALVRNPKVLLLDEATSALDNESEKIVQEALDNAKKNRTCITIAHRLTTIQNSDMIYVLNEGVVGEMGTHTELMEKKGLYYKFYRLQMVTH